MEIEPLPAPTGRQVKVAVRASSVNPIDMKIRAGSLDVGIRPPAVPGFDAAGEVIETGPDVADFAVGDRVFYAADFNSPSGTHADEHLVDERVIWHMPEGLSFVEAAALPLAGGTAWDALSCLYPVRDGDAVLIHGGSGGVGALAVQIALARGAKVFATCHSSMTGHLREIGVRRVIAYDSEEFVRAVEELCPEGVDVVYDTVGRGLLEKSIPAVGDFGTMISIAPPAGNLDRAYRKNLTVKFQFSLRERRKLKGLADLVEAGKFRPHIHRVFALGEISDAHALLAGRNHVFGKLAIDHTL